MMAFPPPILPQYAEALARYLQTSGHFISHAHVGGVISRRWYTPLFLFYSTSRIRLDVTTSTANVWETALPRPTIFWSHNNDFHKGLYASPNTMVMVHSSLWGNHDPIDVFLTLHPRWVSSRDCWTALVPRPMIWEGFHEPLAHINIIQVQGENHSFWELANVTAWQRVEYCLKSIGVDTCKIGVLLPLDFMITPWPESFGYARQFCLRKDAQKAILRARQPF